MVQDIILDIFRKAVARQLVISDLFAVAERLSVNPVLVSQLYKVWLDHNADHPACYAVFFNYAIALTNLGQLDEAIEAYQQSASLNPVFFSARINCGTVYERKGAMDRAVAEWQSIVQALPQVSAEHISYKANALKQITRVYEVTSQYAAAESALADSIAVQPAQRDVIQHWISNRQLQCKWPLMERVHSLSVADVKRAMSPLSISIYVDDPLLELSAAYRYSRDDVGIPEPSFTAGDWLPPTPSAAQRPLKIGYLSSDMRGHAVGYLTSEIFELHDRERVEVFVYFCGVRYVDPTYLRIKEAADHWMDVNDLNDRQLAKQIIDDGIDILIDINGHTKDARTKTLALKPAPIIINWLGYPGTMGSAYHQYIIADPYVIPPGSEIYYTEKVLRLPCYQPNDRKRVVSPPTLTRAEVGLPEDALVFCCFNGMQKITAHTFHRWLSIVEQVPDGVLWLLAGDAGVQERLRAVATQRGVDTSRLIFADRLLTPDHVARFRLADLFLDTFPYGAHTTASDALWMGVPIVTMVGRGFASRVCGSLASAAGMGDLVCRTPEEYVTKAIELGNDRAKLASYRKRLADALPTCTLFDTPNLVRHLEGLYEQAWRDLESGFVHHPDLTNLETYHDIGVNLDHDTTEFTTEFDYDQAYIQGLRSLDGFSPLLVDGRLWSPVLK